MSEHGNPPIKITSIIILCVALFVAVMYLYEPFTIKRQVAKLDSLGPEADEAVEYLAQKGNTVEDFLVAAIPEKPGAFRWNALRILEKRGALKRMPETLVLNYMAVKKILSETKADIQIIQNADFEDFLYWSILRIDDLLGKDVIVVIPYSKIPQTKPGFFDMLDHEWVLGIKGIILRNIHGINCVGDIRYFDISRFDNAVSQFQGIISAYDNRTEIISEEGSVILHQFIPPDICDDMCIYNHENSLPRPEGNPVSLRDESQYDFHFAWEKRANLAIFFILLGYDFEFQDSKIILKPVKR
jgi:hypothetical protein